MTHTCTKHQPGKPSCYFNCGCRCAPCKRSGLAQQKRAALRREQGGGRFVPNDMAVARIRALRARGLRMADIARAAGISQSTLSRMVNGDATTTTPKVLAAILAVPATARPRRTPAAGVVRRIEALACLGWSMVDIARVSGVSRKRIANARHWAGDRCSSDVADAVRLAYDQLWDAEAPESMASNRLRNQARQRGYMPPLAWDDDAGPHGIDNPKATPYRRAIREAS